MLQGSFGSRIMPFYFWYLSLKWHEGEVCRKTFWEYWKDDYLERKCHLIWNCYWNFWASFQLLLSPGVVRFACYVNWIFKQFWCKLCDFVFLVMDSTINDTKWHCMRKHLPALGEHSNHLGFYILKNKDIYIFICIFCFISM